MKNKLVDHHLHYKKYIERIHLHTYIGNQIVLAEEIKYNINTGSIYYYSRFRLNRREYDRLPVIY